MNLLRERGFALLWIGQSLSSLADWALRAVVLIWVYALTGSGIAVSVVGLAEALPLLLAAPFAGVFVDRWNRAYTMSGAVVARAIALLPLLAVNGRANVPIIVAVTLVANVAAQFFMPAASAAVPVVAGPERVGQANSILSLSTGAIAALGPGAAALLYSAIGPHATVLVLGSLYLVALPVLLAIPAPRPKAAASAGTSLMTEMRDGFRYMRRSSLLLVLAAIACVAMLGIGAISVLDVVFVTRALHRSAASVGLLLSASGVGELTGGIAMSVLAGWAAGRYHRLLGPATIVCGLALLGYAAAPNLPIAVAVLFVLGLSFPPLLVSFMTLTQLVTENAFMGRVMSLISVGMAGAQILSMTCGGVLTDLFGVRQVIAAGAVLMCAAGVLGVVKVRSTPAPRSAANEDSAREGPTTAPGEAAS